jgi:hypothetical protein
MLWRPTSLRTVKSEHYCKFPLPFFSTFHPAQLPLMFQNEVAQVSNETDCGKDRIEEKRFETFHFSNSIFFCTFPGKKKTFPFGSFFFLCFSL